MKIDSDGRRLIKQERDETSRDVFTGGCDDGGDAAYHVVQLLSVGKKQYGGG